MRQALEASLAQLSITEDGQLQIPSEADLFQNPPVPMTDELLKYFADLRAEFPQKKPDSQKKPDTQTQPTPRPDSGSGQGSGSGSGSGPGSGEGGAGGSGPAEREP